MIRRYVAFLIVAIASTDALAQLVQTDATRVVSGDASDAATPLKLAARLSFQSGDSVRAHEQLTALLDLYRRRNGEPDQQCQYLCDVTREYLRGGSLRPASALMGEAADLELPFDETADAGLGSVAGGWNRRLAGLNAGERFELLREWSMPSGTRRAIRVLTVLTPTDSPPAVFARSLGERPRRDSFATPVIGQVQGLFCSAWELVKAADDAGRLRRLSADVAELVEQNVANARFVLTLIHIADATREDDQLRADLLAFASNIGDARQPDGFGNPDVVTGLACLTREWLRPIGEQILRAKLRQTYGSESLRMRPFLRYAHATAIRQRYDNDSLDLLTGSNLALWLPSSTRRAWPNPHGNVRPVWLSDGEHILHAYGPRNDYLFFKYPIAGEFEFSCETQFGGMSGTDGCIAYGGLGYEVWAARHLAKVWDASFHKIGEIHSPFIAHHPIPTFNEVSLKSGPSGVEFSAKGHPNWIDPPQDGTSPWIGIRSFGERAPFFRNLKLSGNPVIPREVSMSAGSSLRGWATDYYDESAPLPPRPEPPGIQAFSQHLLTVPDWSANNGVIQGATRQDADGGAAQSRLYYLRPLQNGESISYEFEYQPGEVEVHPTLGRIAFLIEPDGVRLHWMTDGDQEWTGLAEDNAVVEPLSRRGPKPLPLVAGAWNRLNVALKRDTLTLTLNDVQIYAHKVEALDERSFGFYHDKSRTAVRVRKIVLRGDWPDELTQEVRDGLLALSNPVRSVSQRRALAAIFDDQHVHGSVLEVHRRAASMPDQMRYEFLSGWVLPGDDHESLRLALDFTPTNPAPPVSDTGLDFRPARSGTGGDLVSPALDLIAAAKEVDKLSELRQRISAVEPTDDGQRRSQLAMLALVDIAGRDLGSAGRSLDALAALVAASDAFAFSDRWPETLAIHEGSRVAETRDVVLDMALHILVNQIRKNVSSGYDAWDQHMRALGNRVNYFNLLERDPPPRDNAFPLVNWIPTSRDLTRTRGQGFPRSIWARSAAATIENYASHEDDYLFYRIPLRGNFEVECDMTGFGYREMAMWVAGRWVGPVYTCHDVDVGTFRDRQRLPLDPPFQRPEDWLRYRAVVRDGVRTTYVNGRKIHEQVLEAEHDPWLAIRGYYTTLGAVRNLRITGEPEIPREVRLTANSDLSGWSPINHGHHVGRDVKWQPFGDLESGGGIRGIRWTELPGSHQETMLRYHRPMVEDGTIEYEFYYRESEIIVYPALDRLAFVLQPDGVRVHWVTDDQFDRTRLAPDNLSVEPDNRRGPDIPPLKPDSWNRMQLSLVGDIVRLKLNGQLVYERKLEATNQRTFGLFHYADRSEAIVRNIVWRGDWPSELPGVAEQELAGEGTEFLDVRRAELTAMFEHDFVTQGLDLERFVVDAGMQTDFDAQPDGLHVTRGGGEGYISSSLVPRITIGGDFDIVAEFDQFSSEPSEGGSGQAMLQAFLDSEKASECLLYRRKVWHRKEPQPIVQASCVVREVGGARRVFLPSQVVEAPGGRLRMARRGDEVYFLFAENDSPHFRLIGSQGVKKDDVPILKLTTQTQMDGLTTVVWRNLTIHAERLSGLAVEDAGRALAELNKEREALPQRFEHNFATDPMNGTRFQAWGPTQPADNDGVRLISIGTDRWTSSGMNSLIGLEGDFDVSLTFDELKLAKPKEAMGSSFYLQVDFPDEARTQANLVVNQNFDGSRQVLAQLRLVDAAGNNQYRRLRSDQVDQVQKLRLARRGNRVSFLYRVPGSDHDKILFQQDILDAPVSPRALRILLHTGGDNRQSEVVLKQFGVRAKKIEPNPTGRPGNSPDVGK